LDAIDTPTSRRLRYALVALALFFVVPVSSASSAAKSPRFGIYPAGAGQADALFGPSEPSIGNDWRTGVTFYQSGTSTYTVKFDAAHHTSAWTDVTPPFTAAGGQDPILWTDLPTGHTISSQLFEPDECSLAAVTDSDGALWVPSKGCGIGAFDDHQSVGGGPYAGAVPALSLYGRAVYYCAHTGATGYCSRSDDGGITFGPAVQAYGPQLPVGEACTGLHGHIRVAPDGDVYLPLYDCANAAFAMSTDNGNSWSYHLVKGTNTQSEGDPSIAAGAKGTLYLAWQEGRSNKVGSRAFAAVSHDRGRTWKHFTDLGAKFRIRNIQFPTVIAGDDDRAAIAFIGTTTPGDDQRGAKIGDTCLQIADGITSCGVEPGVPSKDVFAGVWHLYIAVTYDAGKSWTTVDATPKDPVQRGCVWLGGGGAHTCRNLFDFNDITIDRQGRVLAAFSDGCLRACVAHGLKPDEAYNDSAHASDYRAHHGTIARLESGRGLFARYDKIVH
jgi:hypothetical protein